ncbi:unnamed protein product [Rhizophagus irregularis]|uniref:Uncharacterized protein n=2 Tax=Rhizophagus irregularis TaxID=588596 RepID=A0A915Z1K9_9GLOM|nr:unnamed protein product [Rhizophagus irregularis]CAB5358938.1 unnamed protein product [Rhizophagus irregularis]
MRPFFGRRSEPTTPLSKILQLSKLLLFDFDAIRPSRFIFKSDYNFTIITCLENHINYKSDITHPDETYGPSQLYLGFYQPSPGVFFYEYNEPDEMIDLIIMVKLLNYDNSIITMNMYALVLNQEFIRSSWMNDFEVNYILIISSQKEIIQWCRFNRWCVGISSSSIRIAFWREHVTTMGVVQSYCCGFSRSTQKNLQLTLSTIPFFNTINPDIKNRPSKHALSLAEQNDLILTRIDSLELFLQEYVIDVHYLNGIRDKLAKPRETSTSTTDAMNSFII